MHVGFYGQKAILKFKTIELETVLMAVWTVNQRRPAIWIEASLSTESLWKNIITRTYFSFQNILRSRLWKQSLRHSLLMLISFKLRYVKWYIPIFKENVQGQKHIGSCAFAEPELLM